MVHYIVNLIFTTYTFLLLARVLGSWFPSFTRTRIFHFLSFYTDPYLNLFRKIIPPIGMIDISPMFAFVALQFMEYFFNWILK